MPYGKDEFQVRNDTFTVRAVPGLDDLPKQEFETVWNQLRLMPKTNDIATVLDLGHKNIHLVNMIKERYITEQLPVREAQHNPAARAMISESLVHLPFPEKRFDMVLCANVFQYIRDGFLEQAAREIQRVAARYIMVTVPYRETLSRESLKCHNCGEVFHGRGHTQSFTMRRLKKLFQGWEPVESSVWGEPATIGIEPLYAFARLIGKPWTDMSSICPLCHKPVSVRANENSLIVSLLAWAEREWPILSPQWVTVLFERRS